MKSLPLLVLVVFLRSSLSAQIVPDRRFLLQIGGGPQFGIAPFHRSAERTLFGCVTNGTAFGLSGALPVGKTSRLLLGFRIGVVDFAADNEARQRALARRFGDADHFTSAVSMNSDARLEEFGLTVGYRLLQKRLNVDLIAGLGSGSYKGEERYAVHRKRKGDNYAEDIEVTGAASESHPVSFFYPSLQLKGSTRIYGLLFAFSTVSLHAGTAVVNHYTVDRVDIFGARSRSSFSERQGVLHGGLTVGLEWRIGRSPGTAPTQKRNQE